METLRTLNLQEAAEYLKVGKSTLLRLTAEGKIPSAKVGRRRVYFLQDLADYIKARRGFKGDTGDKLKAEADATEADATEAAR